MFHQVFGYFFGASAVADVDDGTARHPLEDVQKFLGFVARAAYDVGQVLALETHAENILFPKLQPFLDVCHDFGGSGGRQCQYGYSRKHATHLGYLQVGGSEVVSPLRDAVAFVHGYHADFHLGQLGAEDVSGQSFGRDVEELVVAEDGVLQGDQYVLFRHARINGQCPYASLS